jgi:ABC-type branched-subunit amino acid transport system ATPase component/ABC-type branched-subunit amino acid transport system permease subunit
MNLSRLPVVEQVMDKTTPRLRATVGVISAVLIVYFVVPWLFPHSAPKGQILVGAEFGAVNGLLALGLVLTYRASRVINFSYGAMGVLAATFGVELYLGQHVNWFVCILVALGVGAILGLIVDATLRWRFFNSPRLIVMVVTIGFAQVFGGIQLLVPGWLGGPPLVGGFPTGLSQHHHFIFPDLFDGNDLLIVIVVPLILIALSWFLLKTDAGIAVRSVADNSDRAMLLGIPVKRLSTLVWVIAGLLAALTTVLSAPSQGLTISAAAGPEVLLPALAAAVLAGMENLPLAFGAGVGIGIINGLVEFNVHEESTTDVVLLVVILVGLLLQKNKSGRASEVDGTFSASGILKPIPDVLRRLPEVVAGRVGIFLLVSAVVVSIPFLAGPGTTLEYTGALIYGIIALSLVVLTGWGGTVSLGQFALAGVGGVVAGDLIEKANVDLFFCLAAAAAAGAALAFLVGLPALRIRGDFLAVTTLALAVAMNSFILNPQNFPNAIPQQFLRPVLWLRFNLLSNKAYFFFCLAFVVLTVLFIQGLRKARAGRTLLGVRDNPKAASAMGVPPVRVKLGGFMLAGAIAGIGGGLYATLLDAVGYQTFDPSYSIVIFSMAVIGGLNSMSGVLMGVGLIEVLSFAYPKYQLVFTGAFLMLVLLFLPGGLGEGVQFIRDRLLRIVAVRRNILVPSLVADRKDDTPHAAHAPEETDLLVHALSDDGEGDGDPAAAPVPAVAAAAAAVAVEPDPTETLVVAEFAADTDTAQVPAVQAQVDPNVPDTPVVLSCQKVEVSYGPVQILFGVDLDVHEGEIVALLGTNGAGKSTLLKGASGLVKVGGGTVKLGSGNIAGEPAEAIARMGLSLMPGGRGIFPTLTVEENLRLGTWMIRKDAHAVAEAKAKTVTLFPILEQRSGQLAGNLSGGEQQMLSLAMAFMVTPKVLMIDELSLGLAPTIVAQLIDVVKLLHAAGTTIIVVEQSVNVALELAERAVFLEKGEVRFSGRTAELLERPDILRSVFIAGANSVTGDPGGGADTSAPDSADKTVHASASSALAFSGTGVRIPPSAEAPAILECNGIRKTFGGITAIEDISLTLRDGEILGLIGHNGAGKTTFFDCISGFLPLNGGRIRLGGVDIDTWPAHVRAEAGLGRTFQEARLFPSLTVAETISVARERHLQSRDMIAAGLRLPASLDSEADVAVRAEELVELMGLGAFREKLVGELSTGTRRIVELACVLAQEPGVLLLDEPSGGVAQRETEAMGPLLIRVQQHTGCSIMVVEHDMPLLTAICDRMIALELGEVIAEGTPAEVLEHPAVIESYLGTDESTINRSGAKV